MDNITFLTRNDHDRIMAFENAVNPRDADIIEKIIFKNPFNCMENFAYIVEDDSRISSCAGLLPHRQRFYGKELKVGEITCVRTLPEYRKRGYASRLMDYWFDYMKENDMSLCFLFGIVNFYKQYMFEYAAPSRSFDYTQINKNLMAEIKGSYKVEKLQSQDLEQIGSIYEENSRDNPCSEIRTAEYWRFRLRMSSFGAHSWYAVKSGNAVKGYFWLTDKDDYVSLREVGISDKEACSCICQFLFDLIRDRQDVRHIGIKAPLNNPFAVYLAGIGARSACSSVPGVETGTAKRALMYEGFDVPAMYKIIDLYKAMNVLKPEFERRLAYSYFYNYSGEVNILSEAGSVALEFDKGKLDISRKIKNNVDIHIPYNVLTQLITGYNDLSFHKDEVRFPSNTYYRLLNTIFAKGHPFIWDLEIAENLR